MRLVRHRQTKGPATDRLHLNHRATSRLYQSLVLTWESSVECGLGEATGRLTSRRGWRQRWERQGKALWADFGQQNIAAATDWRRQILHWVFRAGRRSVGEVFRSARG